MSKRPGHKAENSPSKGKRIFKIFLWVLFLLIIAVAIFLYWVWENRFSIIETQIINQLEAEGLQVELSLTELTETAAAAENIRISKDGTALITAQKIEVDYIWQEAMEGRVKAVRLFGPKTTLVFDETGKFINPLGEGSGQNSQAIVFPPGGLTFQDGELLIKSPLGDVEAKIRGDVSAPTQANLWVNIARSELSYGDLSVDIAGDIALTLKDESRQIDLGINAASWRYKNMSGEDLSLNGGSDILMTPDQMTLKGPLRAKLKTFDGKAVEGQDIQLDWRGEIGLTRGDQNTLLAMGDWQADVQSFAVTDRATRRNLAETLTLNESLSRTPITNDFAEPLTTSIDKLLRQISVTGAGHISKSPDQMKIKLAAPIKAQGNGLSAILKNSAAPDMAEYEFSKPEQRINLRLQARLDGPYPMSVQGGQLVFKSTNGRNIKGTERFKGQIQIPKSWTALSKDEQPVEIRPLTARVNYENRPGRRRLTLSGPINYDGDIPGGYAKNLEADGELFVKLGERTDLFFTPKPETLITMASFENPTEWTATNISFALLPDPDKPLFSLGGEAGLLSASLQDLSTDLANQDDSRTLNFKFGEADILASVTDTQSWTINGRDVQMTSDNTPSAGTVMTAPQTSITALVTPVGSPQFTINAPSADVKTLAVNAKGLAVQVAGTPEKFRVDYQDGLVNFSATEFDDFKMTGHVEFENDQWIGKADTFLPFDDSTPVNVDYKFIDSRGYADVVIPELSFSPTGLQPQSFIPALQGKIADVWGTATARINLEFSEDDGVVSSGTASLLDMDMGTAPGPLSGLNADLTFSSFFPLVTEGPQTVTIKSWDVGIPLPEGVVVFEAVPDGIKVDSARWPVGTGAISLDPTIWRYTAEENRMKLRVKDVPISEFLGDVGGKNFQATGNVSGLLPIVISGIDVQVEDGTLAVTDGGVVRFSTPFTDKAGEASGYAQLAFDALKEFYYEELEVSLNGPLDGLINVRIVFEGFNPNVMDGAYIRYNINIAGELLNIIRNFQKLGANITDEVKKAVLGEAGN